MQYEQELALLLEKIAYWTPERIRDFYSGSAPPCKKYGEDWSHRPRSFSGGWCYCNRV